MKYLITLAFHMVGGEVLKIEKVSDEPVVDPELGVKLLMKQDSVTESLENGRGARAINMHNVTWVELECEEVL